MVSVDKFFVYGGGRWREVDASSGRIDGWGRAKFLVARGGKLDSTKTRPVLAALRALAENKPSAAKEGPQLPYRFPRHKSREKVHQGCKHQCCHHTNSGSSCISNLNDKASIAIQCNKTDISHNKTDITPKIITQNPTHFNAITNADITQNREKRKRVSSSSEELFQTKIAVATIHSPRKPEAKRRRISSIRLNRNSTSSESIKPAKKSPRLLRKRKRSSSEETIMLESKSDRHRKKDRLRKKRKSSDKIQLRQSTRHNVSIVISDDSDNEETSTGKNKKSQSRFKILDSSSDPKGKYSSIDDSKRKDSRIRKMIKHDPKEKVLRIRKLSKSSTDELRGPKRITKRSSEKVNKNINYSSDERIINKLGPKCTLVLNKVNSTELFPEDDFKPTKSYKKFALVNKHEKIKPKDSLSDKSINPNGSKTLKSSDKHKHKAKRAVNIDELNSEADPSSITLNKAEKIGQVMSKELIIDENDVEILRMFLQKHYPDEDLLRFDKDDEYKKMHFYRINPLVYVERCPRIARMIQDSQDDRLSLVDFASKLGLRSISEASSVKRYRTRRRYEKKNYTEDVEDKENEKPSETSNTQHKAKKVRRKETEHKSNRDSKKIEELGSDSEENVKLVRRKETGHKSYRDDSKDIDKLSSDSGKKMKLVRRKEIEHKSVKEKRKEIEELSSDSRKNIKVIKKTRPKAVSKRPLLNEYSNLEDHAIVSWVSVGGRACSVNGNRIWRMLQEQFKRITGRERTWHSLRNRYLRYILPRLGALALPPSLQTRLRAAAATGELKAKRRGAKRNSIFKTPARGAFSRRPALLESEQDSEKENDQEAAPLLATRPRSPRYSDVTRQFAQKHRYSSEMSSSHEPHMSRRQSPNKSRRNSSESNSNKAKNSAQSRSPTKNRKQSGIGNKSRTRNEISSRKSNTESEESEESDSDDENMRKSNTPRNKAKEFIRKSISQRKSYRSLSLASYDSSDSNSSSLPDLDPPRKRSERRESRSALPRRSQRITSPDTKKSRKSRSASPRRRSQRITSPDTKKSRKSRSASPRRRSQRITSPDTKRSKSPDVNIKSLESRRKSNRKTLDKSNREGSIDLSDNSPILNRRKSSRVNSPERRKSKRVKSASKGDSRNINSLSDSKTRANSPGRRKSNRRNREIMEVSQEKVNKLHDMKSKKTRKLFNPKDIL